MCQVVEEGCGNAPQQSGLGRVLPVYQVLGCWGREENVTGMASWSFMFCTIFALKDPHHHRRISLPFIPQIRPKKIPAHQAV